MNAAVSPMSAAAMRRPADRPARLRAARAARVGLALVAALGALALGGCGATVRLVPEPLDCPVPADLLAQRCAEPQKLDDGATYEQVLRAGGRDRDALRQCALHDQTLAKALTACNEAIARHREALRALNREAAAAR